MYDIHSGRCISHIQGKYPVHWMRIYQNKIILGEIEGGVTIWEPSINSYFKIGSKLECMISDESRIACVFEQGLVMDHSGKLVRNFEVGDRACGVDAIGLSDSKLACSAENIIKLWNFDC